MTKLKKSISILLALLLIFSVAATTPVYVSAETGGDYEYEVLEDGTAEITNYNGSDESITIPETLDGYSVASIGDSTFYGNTRLTSVTILDGITSIGNHTFNSCTSLESITIPEGVTSIGSYTFANCKSLKSITIPKGVTSIGTGVFADCKGLVSINVDSANECYCSVNGNLYNKDKTELIQYSNGKTETSFAIPDSVTRISGYAFAGCTSLSSATIPSSVTSIGYYAFDSCTSLTSVTIPESVTSIGEGAFDYCSNLKSVKISSSVSEIGESAFGYFWSNDTNEIEKVENFTIYGYKNTAAERYATDNIFTFVDLGTYQPTGSSDLETEPTTAITEPPQPDTAEPTETETIESTEPATTEPIQPAVTKPQPTNTAPATPAVKPNITKKDNPIKVTVKAKTVKLKKLKKKAQKVKAITIKGEQGKVSCKITKAAKIKKYLKINAKGVITFNKWKKAKKGTYSITVQITAKGNANYNSKKIVKTIKIKVK